MSPGVHAFVLSAVALSCGGGGPAGPAGDPFAGRPPPANLTGRILFTSWTDFSRRIGLNAYRMNADGSNLTQITVDGSNRHATWSPDGQQVAVTRTGGVTSPDGLYVLNAGGTGGTGRISGETCDWVDWSPDGRRFVCVTESGGLAIMNSDGTDYHRITSGPDGTPGFSSPEWSPDGTRIVAQREGIVLLTPEGVVDAILTSDRSDGSPTWSPDGRRIAFVRLVYLAGPTDGQKAEILVMNADGSGQTQLTRGIGSNTHPTWSPDGTKIAFYWSLYSERIVIMNADGSQPGVVWKGDGKISLLETLEWR